RPRQADPGAAAAGDLDPHEAGGGVNGAGIRKEAGGRERASPPPLLRAPGRAPHCFSGALSRAGITFGRGPGRMTPSAARGLTPRKFGGGLTSGMPIARRWLSTSWADAVGGIR